MIDENSVHFSSKSGEWRTPGPLFDAANKRWGPFSLDAAASRENALCPVYYSKTDDALTQHWHGIVWCNPPYGRDVGLWVARAAKSVEMNYAYRVVMLLPARTDTKWWQKYVKEASEIHFLPGRVKFSNSSSGAPFPSAVVVFQKEFSYERR